MMNVLAIPLKQKLNLVLICVLTFALNPAIAKSDKQLMEEVQRAREMSRPHENHSNPVTGDTYRGVYYGYLPCTDNCSGIKMTLSLKNKNNYLLVTQYAQAASREYFEKGKYNWDEDSRTVTLISRKDSNIKKFIIKDEATLIQLASDGTPITADLDKYALRRSDTVQTREMHGH